MSRKTKKELVTCEGPYQPTPLAFIRSRACAELSPHAVKLLVDIMGLMGPNGFRNGDISLAPKVLAVRGWTSRATLDAARAELQDAGLLVQTRQGGRMDCSLWALTLYAICCDRKKLDVGAGSYERTDWMQVSPGCGKPPTKALPAVWKRARKNSSACPVAEQDSSTSFRHGTNTGASTPEKTDFVPPRNENRTFTSGDCSATGHLSEVAI